MKNVVFPSHKSEYSFYEDTHLVIINYSQKEGTDNGEKEKSRGFAFR